MSTQPLAQRTAEALVKIMGCKQVGQVLLGEDYIFQNSKGLTDTEIMAGLRSELPDVKFFSSSDQVSLTAKAQTGDEVKFVTTWDSAVQRENLFVTFHPLI